MECKHFFTMCKIWHYGFDNNNLDYEDPTVDLLVMFTFGLLDIPAGSRGVWDNWFHLAEGRRRWDKIR